MRELVALVGDQEMGRLRQDSRGRLSFEYEGSWRAQPDAHPLSLSLPLALRQHGQRAVSAFSWGLLPDNAAILERWAQRFHVSATSAFGLLRHVGADCAGAVRFTAPERLVEMSVAKKDAIIWLGEAEIARRLRALGRDAAAWRLPGDHAEFCLGGARAKTALVLDKGRFGLPSADVPTTHILKPGREGLTGDVENRHFCLLLARRIGLPSAASQVMHFEDQAALVLERFDRVRVGGAIVRAHQEDLAQALGVPRALKYEHEGGPGPKAVVELLRHHSRRPEEDTTAFLLALAYGFLIGSNDAHAGNYGLLIGAGGWVRLAPLYDVTSALPEVDATKVTLAMRIGGKDRLCDIGAREWATLARELGLDPDEIVSAVHGLARALPEHAAATLERCRADGLHHSVLKRLVAAIRERAQACLRG